MGLDEYPSPLLALVQDYLSLDSRVAEVGGRRRDGGESNTSGKELVVGIEPAGVHIKELARE